MTHGVDIYLRNPTFVASNIKLTRAFGVASTPLAEFVALGMLWHSKKVLSFQEYQNKAEWHVQELTMLKGKKIVVLGFGSIGSNCGKIAKHGFGMNVVGIDKYEVTDPEIISCATEIAYLDSIDKHLKDADFVVSVLPHTPHSESWINNEHFFSKMKQSAVFINIGRGSTVNEGELITALQE